MKKKILSLLLGIALALSLSVPAFAAPAPTTQDIFNAAPLTPRESTNATVAKYVKETIAAITTADMSTYKKVEAIYNWSKGLTFLGKGNQYLDNYGATYMEGAALYGFENKKALCENYSATMLYMFRYLGLDAQWAYGKSPTNYHIWTEILIGGTTYIFDAYPGLETAFVARQGLTTGKTQVNGFTHYGYVMCFTKENEELRLDDPTWTNDWDLFAQGNMFQMRALNGTSAGQTLNLTKTYTDGTPSYTWHLPFSGEEKVTMAAISKFYEPTDSKAMVDAKKLRFGGVAGKSLTAYTVKTGENISMEGSSMFMLARLKMANGKLQTAGADSLDFDRDTKWVGESIEVDAGGGKTYDLSPKGVYVSFSTEGYYLMELMPWNKYCLDINPASPTFYTPYDNNMFRYGYAVVHVVK